METWLGLPFSPSRVHPLLTCPFKSKSTTPLIRSPHYPAPFPNQKRISAVISHAPLADPAQAEVTWQVVVGAIAGTTPFVVAGIEFSKRIVAQRRCEVCKGSGLVSRDSKYYFRCPGCGGFLPWQSWKRFFSG